MSTLYVSEQGARLHKRGKRLLVCKGNQLIDDIPIIKLKKVVLLGKGVSITTPAMFDLMSQGVDVVYMTQRGRFVSRLIGKEHNNCRLRFAQALFVGNMDESLHLAKFIVEGKIKNQRTLVRRHSHEVIQREMRLDLMETRIKQVNSAQTPDELRGVEGMAANHYFSLYKHLLKSPREGHWGFYERNYYPPKDPINAILSFGYTMLLNEVIAACQQIGLDPYLGCLHAINYGRPSLALDIMEEFRPVIVDSLVLDLVNHGRLKPKDFVVGHGGKQNKTHTNGVYMTPEARAIYLTAFEVRMNQSVLHNETQQNLTFRQILGKQSQQVARIILGKQSVYQPYVWR
jgi:CRISP-associated protein Cas1